MTESEMRNLPEEVPHDQMELFLKECRLAGIRLVCCWQDPETRRPESTYTELVINPKTGWIHLIDNDKDEGVIATYLPTGYIENPNPLWKRALNLSELSAISDEENRR